MIVNDTEALARLNSPSNLMNRLRETSVKSRSRAMNLFGIGGQDGVKDSPIRQAVSAVANTSLAPPEKKDIAVDNSNPSQVEVKDTVKIDNLIENAESQIGLANSHNKALKLLETAVDTLTVNLERVDPEKLPAVINAASKVVNDIRRERNDAAKANNGNSKVNIIFYTPEQRKLSDYAVIDV